MSSLDPRTVLGVSTDASRAEVTKAYRALAKQWHPDVQKDQSAANIRRSSEFFGAINAAYQSLVKPEADGQCATVDAEAMSETIETLFLKSWCKARGPDKQVVLQTKLLEQPIDGFTMKTGVVGDGNCSVYVLAFALRPGLERALLWPEDYNLGSFLDSVGDEILDWYDEMGKAYREGDSDGATIIAAAAVVRSRLPEDKVNTIRKFEFAHSLEEEDVDVLTNLLGVRAHIHVQVSGIPPYSVIVGRQDRPVTTVGMLFTDRGGGHYENLSGYEHDDMDGFLGEISSDDDGETGEVMEDIGLDYEHDDMDDFLGEICSDADAGASLRRPPDSSATVEETSIIPQTTAVKRCAQLPALQEKRQRLSLGSTAAASADGPPTHAVGSSANLTDGPGLEDYLQHESEFQAGVFAQAADDLVWESTSPVMNESEKDDKALEALYGKVLVALGVDDLPEKDRLAVKAILFIAGLHELEAGVSQAAMLFNFLRLMKAHVDGGYRAGKMLQWDKCSAIPPDVHLLVTKALKVAATYYLQCSCDPRSAVGIRELVTSVSGLQRSTLPTRK